MSQETSFEYVPQQPVKEELPIEINPTEKPTVKIIESQPSLPTKEKPSNFFEEVSMAFSSLGSLFEFLK